MGEAIIALFSELPSSFVNGFYDADHRFINEFGLSILATTAANAYRLAQSTDYVISNDFHLPLDESGTHIVSDIGNLLPPLLIPGFLLYGQMNTASSQERRKAFSTAMQISQTLALTMLTTNTVKVSVGRLRPNGESHLSFPSNHTAGAFAAATVIAYEYPWYVGLSSIASAALIGLTRVDLRKHFPSDVVAGAGIGMFYATAIHLQHNHARGDEIRHERTMLMPLVHENTYGMSLTTTF